MTGQTSQANEDVFTLHNHPAGRIQPRNGPVFARGPYVWYPCTMGSQTHGWTNHYSRYPCL